MKKMFMLMMVYFFMTGSVWAAGAVQIESEQMTVNHLKSQAEFKGGVHLIRDDFELRCDRLLAFYKNNTLQRAKAFGRVRMKQGSKRGASEKATFNQATHMLTLIGKASVEDKNGVVRGEKIQHNLETKHTQVMKGAGGRVKFTIEGDDTAGAVQ